ncbi:hypothetical protein AB6831_02440 [Carnobacterium divergens]|uniref:hypothetical protein n=1 Tax=Carnobacterium divergens TaxID=2748 RepID=UPI001072DC4C|nr:hypothetical protein [Carnobacterium divergens]MCO6016924.1 hypothetical protein [Carnobacterium divergens]MPQ22607.1 hypothetical protein [Carnobacterium divergens]
MRIDEIMWINETIKEAEVEVTDDRFKMLCFSQPLDLSVGDELKEPVYCLDVTNIMVNKEFKEEITKLTGYFSYLISGKLIDVKEKIVKVGGFLFELDTDKIDGDIIEDSYISFECTRVDIF